MKTAGRKSKNIEDVRHPHEQMKFNKKNELRSKMLQRIYDVDKADMRTDMVNGFSNTPYGINKRINKLKSQPVDKDTRFSRPQKFTQVTPGKWTSK